jgi:hypothetical protein
MHVQFVKHYQCYSVGDGAVFDDLTASALVRAGYAVQIVEQTVTTTTTDTDIKRIRKTRLTDLTEK